ncbi:uncharacterized protein [Drosophila kikkawai]|uniref:Uncharacterized protein n=1 Tax=Drosophila kikkawai TaxID=30033 RepID=A0A6P4IJT6_DROKI|nr:uncharacterized protein C1orf131 [Drosophila kikkawai]KAH8304478.1 hypothetical protein KR059_010943 [Drosophila kikkawai]
MNVSEDFKPVPTKAALALQKKQQASSEFKALVFQEPQYLPKSKSDSKPLDQEESQPKAAHKIKEAGMELNPEFDIKKARHEILNFATRNQRVIKNKRKMEMFQLAKLGAKPLKKPARNYKELKDERQRLHNIREERKKFHQLGKNQAGAASVKCRTKGQKERNQKKRAPVSAIDQHYGKAQPKFKARK